MLRRMEDRIRKLCDALVIEQNPAMAEALVKQLREELHGYVAGLRTKAAKYPFIIKERRGAMSAASTEPPSTAIEAAADTETSLTSKAG